MSLSLVPYLNFPPGKTREAMEYYQGIFGGDGRGHSGGSPGTGIFTWQKSSHSRRVYAAFSILLKHELYGLVRGVTETGAGRAIPVYKARQGRLMGCRHVIPAMCTVRNRGGFGVLARPIMEAQFTPVRGKKRRRQYPHIRDTGSDGRA